MKCGKCSTENSDTSKFCVRCGDRLSDGNAAGPPPVSVAVPLSPVHAEPVELRSANDLTRAMNDPGVLVLVYFWATFCGPCKKMSPAIRSVARSYPGRLQVLMVDVDQHGTLAEQHEIRSIPTVRLFKGSRLISSSPEAMGEDELRAMIEAGLQQA